MSYPLQQGPDSHYDTAGTELMNMNECRAPATSNQLLLKKVKIIQQCLFMVKGDGNLEHYNSDKAFRCRAAGDRKPSNPAEDEEQD